MSVRSAVAVLTLVASTACGRSAIPSQGDGLDVSGQPAQVQADYAIFANRCSKCHSLSRPLALASHETSDEFWRRYVARMRRQQGSGITAEDSVVILRFLHYYTRLEAEHRREGDAGAPEPLSPATSPPPTPLSPATPAPARNDAPNDGGLE